MINITNHNFSIEQLIIEDIIIYSDLLLHGHLNSIIITEDSFFINSPFMLRIFYVYDHITLSSVL